METSPSLSPSSGPIGPAGSGQMRWSLPVLLDEVKRDRSSAAFAMEKLDQATINLLFAQQRSRRDCHTARE
jgi:hypothetical protein